VYAPVEETVVLVQLLAFSSVELSDDWDPLTELEREGAVGVVL